MLILDLQRLEQDFEDIEEFRGHLGTIGILMVDNDPNLVLMWNIILKPTLIFQSFSICMFDGLSSCFADGSIKSNEKHVRFEWQYDFLGSYVMAHRTPKYVNQLLTYLCPSGRASAIASFPEVK